VILAVILHSKPTYIQIAGALTLVGIPSAFIQDYGLAILQGRQRYRAFNILRSLQPSLYACAAASLYLLHKGDLVSLTSALIMTSVIASTVLSLVLWRELATASSAAGTVRRADVIRFGLRSFLGSVSPLETFRLDQAVIGLFLAPAALGLYVVGLAFTNLPRFIAQSIGMVAYPHIAGTRNYRWSSMWSFFWPAVGLSAVVVLVLVATAPLLVPAIFGKQFSDAVAVTRILLIGSLFFAARRVLTDSSRGVGRPAAGSVAEIASWVCLLPTVALLVPRFGIQGVAIALTSAAAFSFLVLCVILLRDRPTIRLTKEDSPETVGAAVGL
jgi:O-antigen/teichoic acid export membrane protein